MAFRVVRLQLPGSSAMTVVATFAAREAAEQCAHALERTLPDDFYAVVDVDSGAIGEVDSGAVGESSS